jgi:xanthosine utilization system XapX-like protein
LEDPESAARAGLRRSLLIYAALLAADLAVIYYIVQADTGGAAFVTLSIIGVVGLLLGYQVVQHLRDLGAPLAESAGVVQRKWKRADLIIAWDSFYVTVDRTVFRVRPDDYLHIDEAMYVKVVHFPNTLNVVSIHEILRPPPDPSTLI